MNYIPYLNREHSYQTNNCLSLIAEFYEKELSISFSEEKLLFNNFSFNSIKDIRRIPLEQIYELKNWIKIPLTNLQEYDIIIYSKNCKLAHFAMYVGEFKILTLIESQKSVLKYLDDKQRTHIDGVVRHRSLAS